MDRKTGDPVVAVFDFENHGDPSKSSVLQHSGGAWRPLGDVSALPLVSYKWPWYFKFGVCPTTGEPHLFYKTTYQAGPGMVYRGELA